MSEEALPDNVLFDLYEQYIGEPETETDVYAGFGLFFVGVSFAIVALLAFVAGVGVHGYRADGYFPFARAAFSLGLLSLPLAMLAIVVLLPTEKRATYGAGAGVAVAVVATIAFAYNYPSQWAEFGPGTMITILGTYALGLTFVIAATGTALVAHQLEQARAPTPSEVEAAQADDESEETVSDEQVREDIDAAMEGVDLTWGGVEQSENRKLNLSTDFVDEEMEGGDIDVEAQTTVSSGTDSQVQGLKEMKGGDVDTATSESTVDDQTAALNELKKQKQEDQVPENAPTAERGFLQRLLGKLGLQ